MRTARASRRNALTHPLLISAALLVGLLCAASAFADAQQVSLYVNVEEKDNLVTGLQASDFRLTEDGEPRSFQLEMPETPILVTLLVEDSQRSWFYFNDIRDAMQGFVDAAPDGNWYSLVTFAHTSTVQVDFTHHKQRILDAFNDLSQPGWDETDVYDAVFDTLDKLSRLPGRRVLIVIASGFDSFSAHTLDDVQKKVESTDVVIYGVGAGSALRGYYEPYLDSMQRMNLIQAQQFLDMLADASGGDAWFPRFEGAFPDVMKGIVQDLQSQYRLVYTPQVPADGNLHKVKVEAFRIVDDKRQDFKVHVRKGWRLPKELQALRK